MNGFITDFINQFFVNVCGASFLFIASFGLVIGTFELTFKRVSAQLLFRMLIHLICVPIGVYFYSFQTFSVFYASIYFRLILVGSLGVNIVSVELGTVKWTKSLLIQLIIYFGCIALGIFKSSA